MAEWSYFGPTKLVTGEDGEEGWDILDENGVAFAFVYKETLVPGKYIQREELPNREDVVKLMTATPKLAEALRVIEELIAAAHGFQKAISQDTGRPYPWPALEAAYEHAGLITAKVEGS